MKTFIELIKEEEIDIPRDIKTAKRLQRFYTGCSIAFVLDEASLLLLQATLPFEKCQYTFLKRMAENILIAHRQRHRKTDESRLDLMKKDYHGYHDDSFYYSDHKKDDVD
ncbi:hypothetical protein [Enterococcus casseliflavus]|uniref:hypothetical protein n=1 Tax=Enterococcus casseliflavus TaxID=37734 RepID=UPI002543F7AF|nr:hypothetical protein [Enterococcus casseliflavus]MDK4450051.1 hypothetical protein [Enterococcus casseliflavus]